MSERQINKSWGDTEKQGRGPNIPDDWKSYIMVQATKEPYKPRMLLADEILEQMKTSRDVRDKLPERESIAKLISQARNLPYTEEDNPWSIAASVRYGLSPEATKDLFDIWRASLAMGSPISIRQAKWIVYIRNLFYQGLSTGNRYSDKVNRNLWLIRQSWLYSILERASRIMGKNFDTPDLDAASFMLPWERATAIKSGKVSHVNYSQEAMTRIEKHGTSLTSPAVSIKSVEQAVWLDVRDEPPPHLEVMAAGFQDEVLPEEDDLVAAYWLRYLSKGPLWNNLPLSPEVQKELEHRAQLRKKGAFVPDSGGFPGGSLYSRQLSVRCRLLKWVKARSNMTIRDYHTLTEQHPALVLSPKLLTMVGYEVLPEDLKLYAKLHEKELKAEHDGWNALPADVQQRFIHDEQTDDDLTLLEDADNQSKIKQKQLEQEFIELVEQKGGVPGNEKGHKIVKTFWDSIRDEFLKRHPELTENEIWYPQWEDFRYEYERIIKERNLNNKSSDSIKGGTK